MVNSQSEGWRRVARGKYRETKFNFKLGKVKFSGNSVSKQTEIRARDSARTRGFNLARASANFAKSASELRREDVRSEKFAVASGSISV